MRKVDRMITTELSHRQCLFGVRRIGPETCGAGGGFIPLLRQDIAGSNPFEAVSCMLTSPTCMDTQSSIIDG